MHAGLCVVVFAVSKSVRPCEGGTPCFRVTHSWDVCERANANSPCRCERPPVSLACPVSMSDTTIPEGLGGIAEELFPVQETMPEPIVA
jgi:hypothetical protein